MKRSILALILLATLLFTTFAMPVSVSAETTNVIFIQDDTSMGDGSGKDANNPFRPTDMGDVGDDKQKNTALYQAVLKLAKGNGGTIVFCGVYTLKNAESNNGEFRFDFADYNPNVKITYTSNYGGVNYNSKNGAALKFADSVHYVCPTQSLFDWILILTYAKDNSICAGYNALEMGWNIITPTKTEDKVNFLTIAGGEVTRGGDAAIQGRNSSVTIKKGFYHGVFGGDLGPNTNGAHKGRAYVYIDGGHYFMGDYDWRSISGTNRNDSVAWNGSVYMRIRGGIFQNARIQGCSKSGFVNDNATVTIEVLSNFTPSLMAGNSTTRLQAYSNEIFDGRMPVSTSLNYSTFETSKTMLPVSKDTFTSITCNNHSSFVYDAAGAKTATTHTLKCANNCGGTKTEAHNFVAGKCSVCAMYDDLFKEVSITLRDDLAVNYYVTKSDLADPEMRFTINGYTKTVAGEVVGDQYKFVFDGVAPQWIGDNIKAELLVEGQPFQTKEEYSVVEYLNALMASGTPANASLKALAADLLIYGGAAQKYLGMEDTLSASVAGGTVYQPLEAVTGVGKKNSGDNVKFSAATVLFDSANKLAFKLTATDIDSITFKVKVNGGEETVIDKSDIISNGDHYIILTDGIKATAFDDIYTVTAYNGADEVAKIAYSVKAYVYSKQNGTDSMAALARATYNYGLSATAYTAQ